MLLLSAFLTRRYNGGLSTYGVKLVERLSNVLTQAVLTILEGRREEADEVEVDLALDSL